MPTATVPARISDVSTIALSISHSFFNKGASAQRDFGYNWSTVSLTKFQIAAHLLHGKAIAVAALRNGHRQTGAFLSAQIILIDLDSGPDVQTLAEDPFIQQHAFLIYATSSSTPEQPRSRLAFVLDTLVTDPGLYKQWVKRLQADFGRKGFIVDVACKDAVRMFFGSHQAERVLFETNVLPLTYLESLPDSKRMPKTKAVASAERPQTERHLPPMSDPEREAQARQIASALAVIPVDQPYNEWIDTLMAVHSAFPDERGLQLVEVSPLNYSGEAAEKWWSFQPARQGGITIDTLWFLQPPDFGH